MASKATFSGSGDEISFSLLVFYYFYYRATAENLN